MKRKKDNTCAGLEYCCSLNNKCDSRNESLLNLGITPADFLRIKNEAKESFRKCKSKKSKLICLKDLPDKIGITLFEDFLKEIKERLLKDFKNYTKMGEKFDVDRGTIFNYLNARTSFKVKTFLNVCDYLKTKNIEYIPETIKAISSAASKIKNPKLPIKETPEVFNIIGHITSDGSATEGQQPSYINSDDSLIKNFEEKIRIFGDIKISKVTKEKRKEHHKEVKSLHFPKIVSDILSHHYNISFDKEEIPKKLFSMPKEYAREFIKAVFDDECTIITKDKSISIRCTLIDEMFVFGLKRLLLTKTNLKKNQLTLTTYYNKKYKKNFYNLWIVRKGVDIYAKEIGFDGDEKNNKLNSYFKKLNATQKGGKKDGKNGKSNNS